jgi:hypothetical protein
MDGEGILTDQELLVTARRWRAQDSMTRDAFAICDRLGIDARYAQAVLDAAVDDSHEAILSAYDELLLALGERLEGAESGEVGF